MGEGFVEELLPLRRALRDGVLPYGPSGGLPDNSFDYHQQSGAHAREWLAQTRALRRNAHVDDQETLDVLAWDLERDIALEDYYWHPFPLGYANSELRFVVDALQLAATVGEEFCEPAQADIRFAPAFVDNITLKLVTQIERGLTVPAAEATRALEAVRRAVGDVQGIATRAEQSNAESECVRATRRDLVRLVNGPLSESLARLQATLADRYLPSVDETSRLALAPDAEEFHARLIELRTSHRATPAEEHEAARHDLAEIGADLARMRRAMGVEPRADVFHASLARDRRWLARDADDVARRLNEARERIAPLLEGLFATLPTTPYRIAQLDDSLSTTLLNGFFQPPTDQSPRGTYYFNATQLDVTTWLWATPLISHELMPGHHLQASLVHENPNLVFYRKWFRTAGYSEGWGEYARRLMEEAGLYADDPYGLYASRLIDRRFALRSVVDTGVHARSWTWAEADATLATDPLTRPGTSRQIALAAATLRGIGLTYWRGLQAFAALRRATEQRLGAAFDLRAFNNAALAGGALPFELLERRVRRTLPG